MKLLYLFLLTTAIVLVFTIVFKKAKENFDNVLTDQATTQTIRHEQRKCDPVYGALNQNDNGLPISADFRIQGSGVLGNDTCYIKKSDGLFNTNSNCSLANPNIYSSNYHNVVHSIFPGSEVDPTLSTVGEVPVCYIRFNSNLNPEDVIGYSSYVNDQDPSIQYYTSQFLTCSNNYTTCQSNLNANMAMLAQTRNDNSTCAQTASNLNVQVSTLSNTLSAVSYSNAVLQSTVNNLNSQVGNCSSMQSRIDGMTNNNATLQGRLNALNTSNLSLTTQLNTANKQLREAIPGGSWWRSCKSFSYDVNTQTLTADCYDPKGKTKRTTLRNCKNAWNNNGNLQC
jgi:hypothetical protein